MNNNKNKPFSKRVTVPSVISLVVGIVLVAFLLLSVTTKFNQVATAQQVLLPVVPSSSLPSVNNINNQLAALTQLAAPIITATPFLPIAGQAPLIQGSSTNGFVSFLCPSNGGVVTPNPSALSFQVSSPSVSQLNPILTTTTTATSIGSFILSNSLGVPSVAGQISSGQISGNTFTLQGTLTSITANTLSGGLSSSFCTTVATSPSSFPTFNGFTITGTCGTNVPLAFAIDRLVVGTYTANIACNNIA
ncbi:MAG TPA: hypothetical protein VFI70_10860 [Nitrososphaeraceae archaeon]|nr:hypothetical protein [Nitrososphaeraceae archaeon]